MLICLGDADVLIVSFLPDGRVHSKLIEKLAFEFCIHARVLPLRPGKTGRRKSDTQYYKHQSIVPMTTRMKDIHHPPLKELIRVFNNMRGSCLFTLTRHKTRGSIWAWFNRDSLNHSHPSFRRPPGMIRDADGEFVIDSKVRM